jgi:uncharacterized protein (TIGR00251 family)
MPSVAEAVRPIAGGVRIAVRAQPRASRNAIVGVIADAHGAALKIAVTAPPVEGAANHAIARVLADALDVAPRSIAFARGATGRNKLVDVSGLDHRDAIRRLESSI